MRYKQAFGANNGAYIGAGLGAAYGSLVGGSVDTPSGRPSVARMLLGAGVGGTAGYMAGTHLPDALAHARGAAQAFTGYNAAFSRYNNASNVVSREIARRQANDLATTFNARRADMLSWAAKGFVPIGLGSVALDLLSYSARNTKKEEDKDDE